MMEQFKEEMSLRDYIAIHAMQAMIAHNDTHPYGEVALDAYKCADEMLHWRKQDLSKYSSG